jgi:hypothetical protein
MKHKKKVLLSICLLLSTAFIFPAAQEEEIRLIPDLSIGSDAGDENYIFGGIQDVALDSEENIYIFDWRNLQVRKFDPQGTFLSSLTLEEGQGPGEVSGPSAIVVTPSGEISVYDLGAKRIQMFDSEGQLRKSLQLEFQATHVVLYDSNKIAVLGLSDNTIFHIYDREGRLLESFGQPFDVPSRLSQYKDMPIMRAPMRCNSSGGGRILLTNPHRYEISLFQDGQQLGSIKGKNDAFRPTFVTKSNIGSFGVAFPYLHIIEYQNTLYVCIRALDRDADNSLDVFENGNQITTLTVTGIPYVADAQGRLYFVEEEEFPRVVRYRLKR